MKRNALTYAFPYTLPICAGFLFLGISYGFFASSKGVSLQAAKGFLLFIHS